MNNSNKYYSKLICIVFLDTLNLTKNLDLINQSDQ